jgi:methylenetetrahydrofolate dehydrogenase (NADP+)/methenyltetrahydrofolate cyclohydrolase
MTFHTDPLILHGRPIANDLLDKLKVRVDKLSLAHGRSPLLAIIAVGLSNSGRVYVRRKQEVAESLGIIVRIYTFDSQACTYTIETAIRVLAADESVHGILLQLPLPGSLDVDRLLECIPYHKDADGITGKSLAMVITGNPEILAPPCTGSAVQALLAGYNISVQGKIALVIGRGRVAGLPISIALSRANATVITAHSKTKNIRELARIADIVVVAVGQPGFLRPDMLKPESVVIDVGCNVLDDGSICGDFQTANSRCVRSPVPGGVGPLTVVMLMQNIVRLAEFCYQTWKLCVCKWQSVFQVNKFCYLDPNMALPILT